MPLVIPAFDQYQQPMIPLRGLWNSTPPEGDKLISCEIDWLVTTKSQCVQFSLSGNSPVSLSQIVALGVDNTRSGADAIFVFPDSGSGLTVPAHNQLIAPVFTNALTFYCNSPSAIAGDVTNFQIFNSMPPPVPVAPSIEQNSNNAAGISTANGQTQIVPTNISGTLTGATITFNYSGVTVLGALQLSLIDGTGKVLWTGEQSVLANPASISPVILNGLNIRFQQGIKLAVANSSIANGAIIATVYYTTP